MGVRISDGIGELVVELGWEGAPPVGEAGMLLQAIELLGEVVDLMEPPR